MTRPGRESPRSIGRALLLLLGMGVLWGCYFLVQAAVGLTVLAIAYRWVSKWIPGWINGIGHWWFSGTGRWLDAAVVVIGVAAFLLRRHMGRLAGFSASSLTDLAVLLAGRRGPELRDEWHAHLAGESGHDPDTWPKVRQALGFVASAVQFRLADAADAAWTPADAVLRSRKLSNLVAFGPTTLAALFILRHLGTLGVLTSAESIAAIGGALYGLIRMGRWWRDVKPPEPKARRARE